MQTRGMKRALEEQDSSPQPAEKVCFEILPHKILQHRDQNQSSILLRLPLELWYMVAEKLVIEEDDIIMDLPKRRALPGILHVCHQLRKETAPMYYKNNTFMFHNSPKKFLNALDRKQGHHKLITTIYAWVRDRPGRSIKTAEKWSASTEAQGKLKRGTIMTASYQQYGTCKPMSVYFVDARGEIELYDESLHLPHTTVGSPAALKG